MKYVFIIQCGVDVVFCSKSLSQAYQYLHRRLSMDQLSRTLSYMSVSRHFRDHRSYMVLSPDSLTWYIKKLEVQKLLKDS